ncbi:dTDP-4-amino-4,6-dideoxygalactose transaminase [bacterium]|nr:dTDP-4-amino-4,6-dideoxygalactose transaminase [bacterium]
MATNKQILFNKPYLTGLESELVLDSINSYGHCGNRGYGQKCIELLKERYGFHDVFLTPSCTSALEMGALLADLKPGDEVILPSYTFSSTANAIVLRGAHPVFCEVEPNTMNIDVDRIEGLITERTKMILPIDYAGIPCEIERIMEIAKNHNLTVLQDAAQSTHSKHKNGKWCGAVPPLAAFSFHETKNFTCGEGGALIVNDPDLVQRAHFLQEKGTDRSLVLKGVKSKYSWVDMGSSFLLADILAAMLLTQLEHADEMTAKRAKVTRAYNELFAPFDTNGSVQIPHPPDGVELNHHAFFVIFDTEDHQQQFIDKLRQVNIFAYIGYMPLHSSPFGRKLGYKAEDLPITEDLASRIVRLPFYADLAEDGLDYTIENMNTVMNEIYE